MLSGTQKLKYPFGGSQLIFLAITLLSDGYIILERAGYTDVSVAINLHIVEFISNLIEHERNAIISQCHIRPHNWFVYRQFSLDVQKTFMW